MSVQKVLALDAPLHRHAHGAGWMADLASSLGALVSRNTEERAVRRAARSRADVMSLARRYASTQPEFAKDLYAAAGCDFNL